MGAISPGGSATPKLANESILAGLPAIFHDVIVLRIGAVISAVAIAFGAHVGLTSAAGFVPAKTVRVTYHLPTGRLTFSGTRSFVGTAACSWELPLGTVVVFPDGRPVVCVDRGNLGNDGWIDIYAPDEAFGRDIERAYGQRATVRVFLP